MKKDIDLSPLIGKRAGSWLDRHERLVVIITLLIAIAIGCLALWL